MEEGGKALLCVSAWGARLSPQSSSGAEGSVFGRDRGRAHLKWSEEQREVGCRRRRVVVVRVPAERSLAFRQQEQRACRLRRPAASAPFRVRVCGGDGDSELRDVCRPWVPRL